MHKNVCTETMQTIAKKKEKNENKNCFSILNRNEQQNSHYCRS